MVHLLVAVAVVAVFEAQLHIYLHVHLRAHFRARIVEDARSFTCSGRAMQVRKAQTQQTNDWRNPPLLSPR